MNDIFLSNLYYFSDIKMSRYHYTDNRTVSHPHYIAILLNGNARLVSKDWVVHLEPGDVFYIPMNLQYESFWYGDIIEWKSYGFTYFPEGETDKYKVQKIDCDDELKKQVSAIPTTYENVDSAALGIFFNVLSKILPLMETEKKQKSESLFEKAVKIISENTEWDIPKVAKYCSVSDSTLYSVFKKVSGKTPNQIKHEVLTEKAIRLLTTTDITVQEISDRLGFSSTSYFRKILFENTGKTPREIRKSSVSL